MAKAASLLVEEHDLERGDTLRVDLPPHWLGPVFLGAAWTAGLVVSDADDPDAVVCGPDSVDRWAERRTRSRCSPARCCRSASGSPTPCPTASTTSAWRCGRSRTRSRRTTRRSTTDPAYDLGGERRTQRRAVGRGRRRDLLTDGGRLLTEANPTSPSGIATFAEPLARGGSLVLVAQADRERLEATYVAERATARFPA